MNQPASTARASSMALMQKALLVALPCLMLAAMAAVYATRSMSIENTKLISLLGSSNSQLSIDSYPRNLAAPKKTFNTAAAAAEASSTNPPAIANMRIPDGCPAWMAEYAAFHQQQRGQPGAKYLVYSACPGRSGLGDRVRGMMYLTRQAAASKRVILFTWRNEPHELQRYMPPAGAIDWSLDGIVGYDYPNVNTFCRAAPGDPKTLFSSSSSNSSDSVALRLTDYKSEDSPARNFVKQGGLNKLERYRFVTIHTNEWLDSWCSDCPKIESPMPGPKQLKDSNSQAGVDKSAACLYRYLFGLSDEVQEAAQQHLLRLYGGQAQQLGFQYVAVHMRLGGMEHEKSLRSSKVGRNGPLVDLLHGLACIEKLGQQVGIDTKKVSVLLFTDHHELRNFTRTGGLANTVTSDVTPTHLARMTKEEAADPEAAISTYVDVALLARARCAVYSKSGFSLTAWMMGGGSDCYALFGRGLERCLAGALTS